MRTHDRVWEAREPSVLSLQEVLTALAGGVVHAPLVGTLHGVGHVGLQPSMPLADLALGSVVSSSTRWASRAADRSLGTSSTRR